MRQSRTICNKWSHVNRRNYKVASIKTNNNIQTKELEELKAENKRLLEENNKLKKNYTNKAEKKTNNKIEISYGDVKEYYTNELKDLLIAILSDAYKTVKEESRRKELIEGILSVNKNNNKDKIAEIKQIFKDYNGLSDVTKKHLKKLGFKITDEGKHYKLTYFGDGRYMASLSRTPSKKRATTEMANRFIQMIM